MLEPSLLPLTPAWPASVVTAPAGVIIRTVSIAGIGHVDVAGAVEREVGGRIEPGGGAGAVGAAAGSGQPGQRDDGHRRVNDQRDRGRGDGIAGLVITHWNESPFIAAVTEPTVSVAVAEPL